jgi:general secretion pathway protein G
MTLVEILAVVVILGLLTTALAVGISAYVGEAKSRIAIQQIAKLQRALDAFYLAENAYPGSGDGLSALTRAAATSTWHLEPGDLKDPWGRDYLYLVPGPRSLPYEIRTLGADGTDGGEGENADLSSADLAAHAGGGAGR